MTQTKPTVQPSNDSFIGELMGEHDDKVKIFSALERIEAKLDDNRIRTQSAAEAAETAQEQAKKVNGRVQGIEQTVHGPEDRRGGWQGGGLVDEVDQIKQEVSDIRHQNDVDEKVRQTKFINSRWLWATVGGLTAITTTAIALLQIL